MLLDTLKSGASALFDRWSSRRHEAAAYPLDEEQKLDRAHGRAPLDRHLEILFGDAKIGDQSFAELYRRCLRETGTPVTAAGVFRRFQSRFSLVQYFLSSLAIEAARAEIGVYRGATALLLARAARSSIPAYQGRDFYLVDSFEGTSGSRAEDLVPVRDADGRTHMRPFFPAGRTDTSAELVRGFFREFAEMEIREGWIPQVFVTLPETRWAFVHLDVTLYAPTLAGLEYFQPRLAAGGVIVCDGYGSPFCPGLQQAWDEYCARHDIPFVVLGSRQSVILAP